LPTPLVFVHLFEFFVPVCHELEIEIELPPYDFVVDPPISVVFLL
jgi:hypothetical protein